VGDNTPPERWLRRCWSFYRGRMLRRRPET
jgi:hypothetical protein